MIEQLVERQIFLSFSKQIDFLSSINSIIIETDRQQNRPVYTGGNYRDGLPLSQITKCEILLAAPFPR